MSQFISQQDNVDEYKEGFYPTSKIGHKLLCITKSFGLHHVFHTQYGVIQQSNMSAVLQVVYILFHGLSKITSNQLILF